VSTDNFQVHDGLLAVQQTSQGKRIRIALKGEMDLANAETPGAMLQEALASGKEVVVDLGKLEFLDSTGVAMLVTAMHQGGNRLSFLPSEYVAVVRLLNLTGLDERMNLAPKAELLSPVEAPKVEASKSLQPAA
jgi:anti-anti-sigma factor